MAFVTDIGSSVGSEIAYKLIDNEMYVVSLVTDNDNVDALENKMYSHKSGGRLYIIKRDSHKEENIQYVMASAKQYLSADGVRVLINNFSFLNETFNTLTDTSTDKWQQLIDASILRMSTYAREIMSSMTPAAKQNSHIFNINSIVGHESFCSACKYAVTTLSQTLRKELSESGSTTKVTTITAEAYTAETFLDTPVREYLRHEAMLPSDIGQAVVDALRFQNCVQVPELIIKRKFSPTLQNLSFNFI